MKILLPVDGSELSLAAVHFVLDLATKGLQVQAVLANVQEASNLYELLVAHDPDVLDRVAAEAGVHTLEQARVLLEARGMAYELEVARGDPAHTLVEIAERFGCDMIVMGARGNSALRSAMLGSVSNEVLHASPVPVVIVKSAVDTDELA